MKIKVIPPKTVPVFVTVDLGTKTTTKAQVSIADLDEPEFEELIKEFCNKWRTKRSQLRGKTK